jgi:hypothetical protein
MEEGAAVWSFRDPRSGRMAGPLVPGELRRRFFAGELDEGLFVHDEEGGVSTRLSALLGLPADFYRPGSYSPTAPAEYSPASPAQYSPLEHSPSAEGAAHVPTSPGYGYAAAARAASAFSPPATCVPTERAGCSAWPREPAVEPYVPTSYEAYAYSPLNLAEWPRAAAAPPPPAPWAPPSFGGTPAWQAGRPPAPRERAGWRQQPLPPPPPPTTLAAPRPMRVAAWPWHAAPPGRAAPPPAPRPMLPAYHHHQQQC